MMNEANPFDSPSERGAEPDGKWVWKPTIVEMLVIAGIVFVLVMLLLPFPRSGVTPARRMLTQNHLKMVGLALLNYHDVYGTFPPAVVTDADGKPLYSWRVLILPFTEYQPLYEKFDLSQSWDSETNLPLVAEMPYFFESPYLDHRANVGKTPYLAIVDTQDERSVMRPYVGRPLSEVTDGTNETGVVVDFPQKAGIWTKPYDVSPQELLVRPTIEIKGQRGYPILRSDGSVYWICVEDASEVIPYLYCDDKITPDET